MGQWKEESPQIETFRPAHGVPSSESKTNRRSSTDLSSTNPTTSQRNIDNISSKGVHAFRMPHLLQNLSEEKVEQIRKTMIKHEEMFKEQVQALHKLYNVQRSVMHEIRNISCTPPKLPAFTTGANQLQNDTSKGFEMRESFLESGRGTSSHNPGESHTIPITIPGSFSHSSLTAENIAHHSSHSPLWEGDKNVINSAAIKKKKRRTIDLERPPEEYSDDVDEELETETTEARQPDQHPVTCTEVSDMRRIQLGSNRQLSITTQMEEITTRSSHREWSTADNGTFSQRNTWENVSLKRLRGSEDEVNLLMDMKPTVAVGQQTSIPTKVESTSGRTCFPSQENKMDEKSSQWESINVDQNQKKKKEKWPFDMHAKDKHTETNSKPLLWPLQERAAGTRTTDSSQNPSWMLAPALSQSHGWNAVGDSLRPGQEYISSSKDINLPGKMQIIDSESLNQEAQSCGQTGTAQETSMRQPKTTFQTILASQNYGGTNQLTPVVFTQGYPVGLGAAIPVLGLQLSPEGHRALTAQGFIFPPVNKNTEAAGQLSNAWCTPGTYFQLYPYQQQAIQDPRFSASCQSGDHASMQITRNGGHNESDTHVSSTSQVGHFESLHSEARECNKEISTINGSAGSPGPESSTIPSYKAPIGVPIKLMENGVTLESSDRLRHYHSEGKTSCACKHQLEDIPKSHVAEEKRQAQARISRCGNYSLDTQEIGQPKEESSRGCKDDLQSTETIPREETALLDQYEKRDVLQCKSIENNISLMQREDILHDEWSTKQRAPQDQKELQLFTKKGRICDSTDVQKHTSIHNMLEHSTDKSKHCASEILTSKGTNKTEDLDSSGHGSNNIGPVERKPCRGDSQHLDLKCTHISMSAESKARREAEGIQQSKADLICSTTEPIEIKETQIGLANEKVQSHVICCEASTSFGLTSQGITYGGMTETVTTGTSHAKCQGKGSPLNEHCDVKRTECGSGEMDMENIKTVSLRQSDQCESLINIQTNAESTCIKHTVEVLDEKSTIERMPSQEKSSEATETREECSTNSQESEDASEEGREASESLAAMILLSLAPSESQVKGRSRSSVPTRKQCALQQQGQSRCIGSSSSHSSRDSICHGTETKNRCRGLKRKTYDKDQHGPVGWTKSIRGRRRRTQRPRTHFVPLGKYQ